MFKQVECAKQLHETLDSIRAFGVQARKDNDKAALAKYQQLVAAAWIAYANCSKRPPPLSPA